jgi:hypothetical protein
VESVKGITHRSILQISRSLLPHLNPRLPNSSSHLLVLHISTRATMVVGIEADVLFARCSQDLGDRIDDDAM